LLIKVFGYVAMEVVMYTVKEKQLATSNIPYYSNNFTVTTC